MLGINTIKRLNNYYFINKVDYVINHKNIKYFSTIINKNSNANNNDNNLLKKLKSNKIPIVEDVISPPLSLSTANQKEILKFNVENAVKKYQMHDIDTGSSQVQIAVLTEKIKNLAVHFAKNKKDHSSFRGYWAMIHRRRSLMKHLRKNNFEAYRIVVETLGLEKEHKKSIFY